jgi:hypothetical protein
VTLDLFAGRSLAESLLVDRCAIYRDIEGPLDDTLDPSTLELAHPINDVTTVATDVPCLFSEHARKNEGNMEGGRQTYLRQGQVRVPISTPPTQAGDIIQVTTTARPELQGRRFRVYDVSTNSLATTRKMLVEDETGTARR